MNRNPPTGPHIAPSSPPGSLVSDDGRDDRSSSPVVRLASDFFSGTSKRQAAQAPIGNVSNLAGGQQTVFRRDTHHLSRLAPYHGSAELPAVPSAHASLQQMHLKHEPASPRSPHIAAAQSELRHRFAERPQDSFQFHSSQLGRVISPCTESTSRHMPSTSPPSTPHVQAFKSPAREEGYNYIHTAGLSPDYTLTVTPERAVTPYYPGSPHAAPTTPASHVSSSSSALLATSATTRNMPGSLSLIQSGQARVMRTPTSIGSRSVESHQAESEALTAESFITDQAGGSGTIVATTAAYAQACHGLPPIATALQRCVSDGSGAWTPGSTTSIATDTAVRDASIHPAAGSAYADSATGYSMLGVDLSPRTPSCTSELTPSPAYAARISSVPSSASLTATPHSRMLTPGATGAQHQPSKPDHVVKPATRDGGQRYSAASTTGLTPQRLFTGKAASMSPAVIDPTAAGAAAPSDSRCHEPWCDTLPVHQPGCHSSSLTAANLQHIAGIPGRQIAAHTANVAPEGLTTADNNAERSIESSCSTGLPTLGLIHPHGVAGPDIVPQQLYKHTSTVLPLTPAGATLRPAPSDPVNPLIVLQSSQCAPVLSHDVIADKQEKVKQVDAQQYVHTQPDYPRNRCNDSEEMDQLPSQRVRLLPKGWSACLEGASDTSSDNDDDDDDDDSVVGPEQCGVFESLQKAVVGITSEAGISPPHCAPQHVQYSWAMVKDNQAPPVESFAAGAAGLPDSRLGTVGDASNPQAAVMPPGYTSMSGQVMQQQQQQLWQGTTSQDRNMGKMERAQHARDGTLGQDRNASRLDFTNPAPAESVDESLTGQSFQPAQIDQHPRLPREASSAGGRLVAVVQGPVANDGKLGMQRPAEWQPGMRHSQQAAGQVSMSSVSKPHARPVLPRRSQDMAAGCMSSMQQQGSAVQAPSNPVMQGNMPKHGTTPPTAYYDVYYQGPMYPLVDPLTSGNLDPGLNPNYHQQSPPPGRQPSQHLGVLHNLGTGGGSSAGTVTQERATAPVRIMPESQRMQGNTLPFHNLAAYAGAQDSMPESQRMEGNTLPFHTVAAGVPDNTAARQQPIAYQIPAGSVPMVQTAAPPCTAAVDAVILQGVQQQTRPASQFGPTNSAFTFANQTAPPAQQSSSHPYSVQQPVAPQQSQATSNTYWYNDTPAGIRTGMRIGLDVESHNRQAPAPADMHGWGLRGGSMVVPSGWQQIPGGGWMMDAGSMASGHQVSGSSAYMQAQAEGSASSWSPSASRPDGGMSAPGVPLPTSYATPGPPALQQHPAYNVGFLDERNLPTSSLQYSRFDESPQEVYNVTTGQVYGMCNTPMMQQSGTAAAGQPASWSPQGAGSQSVWLPSSSVNHRVMGGPGVTQAAWPGHQPSPLPTMPFPASGSRDYSMLDMMQPTVSGTPSSLQSRTSSLTPPAPGYSPTSRITISPYPSLQETPGPSRLGTLSSIMDEYLDPRTLAAQLPHHFSAGMEPGMQPGMEPYAFVPMYSHTQSGPAMPAGQGSSAAAQALNTVGSAVRAVHQENGLFVLPLHMAERVADQLHGWWGNEQVSRWRENVLQQQEELYQAAKPYFYNTVRQAVQVQLTGLRYIMLSPVFITGWILTSPFRVTRLALYSTRLGCHLLYSSAAAPLHLLHFVRVALPPTVDIASRALVLGSTVPLMVASSVMQSAQSYSVQLVTTLVQGPLMMVQLLLSSPMTLVQRTASAGVSGLQVVGYMQVIVMVGTTRMVLRVQGFMGRAFVNIFSRCSGLLLLWYLTISKQVLETVAGSELLLGLPRTAEPGVPMDAFSLMAVPFLSGTVMGDAAVSAQPSCSNDTSVKWAALLAERLMLKICSNLAACAACLRTLLLANNADAFSALNSGWQQLRESCTNYCLVAIGRAPSSDASTVTRVGSDPANASGGMMVQQEQQDAAWLQADTLVQEMQQLSRQQSRSQQGGLVEMSRLSSRMELLMHQVQQQAMGMTSGLVTSCNQQVVDIGVHLLTSVLQFLLMLLIWTSMGVSSLFKLSMRNMGLLPPADSAPTQPPIAFTTQQAHNWQFPAATMATAASTPMPSTPHHHAELLIQRLVTLEGRQYPATQDSGAAVGLLGRAVTHMVLGTPSTPGSRMSRHILSSSLANLASWIEPPSERHSGQL